MTHQELGEAMFNQGAGVWSAQRWALFWSMPPEEQLAMAQIAQDSPDPPGASGWTKALAVAATVMTIAGDVVGLGSGIEAIKGLVKTLDSSV